MSLDTVGLIIGLVSAFTAILSALFAWKAVRVAERTNIAGLIAELHQLYRSETNFHATQKVWELYRQFQENPEGTPISYQQASEFVSSANEASEEWKAVHDTWVYWSYLALLVNNGFINDSLAMSGAFGSKAILGFLYPVEKAFINYKGMKYDYDTSLQKLYELWTVKSKKKL